MIVLAKIATVDAVLVTFVIVIANGMGDSPSTPFQGGGLIWLAWCICGSLWATWWVG